MEPPQFPCLSLLEIKHCPKLIGMPLFPSLDDKLHLEDASTEPLQKTMQMKMKSWASSSSRVHPLSELKILWIVAIEDLESLPNRWLQNLTSLQELYIQECPRLTSLPREMHHLTSLQKLHIRGCPLLIERCRKNDGVDWPNIAGISNIETDWCLIKTAFNVEQASGIVPDGGGTLSKSILAQLIPKVSPLNRNDKAASLGSEAYVTFGSHYFV
ncbi:hypothetical protein GH714_004991 [Hevea brasiliensis]|uniref:NB-ARC domain-containing protein n=1 Tax=Hevea brasiliensis TaxID=3981 RepID=A0A6A6LY24_HEVBR|nr:hypothetical protein GH714_004991 [Hevea brasiliensis]